MYSAYGMVVCVWVGPISVLFPSTEKQSQTDVYWTSYSIYQYLVFPTVLGKCCCFWINIFWVAKVKMFGIQFLSALNLPNIHSSPKTQIRSNPMDIKCIGFSVPKITHTLSIRPKIGSIPNAANLHTRSHPLCVCAGVLCMHFSQIHTNCMLCVHLSIRNKLSSLNWSAIHFSDYNSPFFDFRTSPPN